MHIVNVQKNIYLCPDLKHTIVIILSLLLFLQPLSKTWIYMSFKFNQDYIASTQCENRDKPAMHCNGKCQLVKSLKKDDKTDDKQSSKPVKNQYEEISYCNKVLGFDLTKRICITQQTTPFIENQFLFTSKYLNEIFQPPKFYLI